MATLKANGVEIAQFTDTRGVVLRLFQSGNVLVRRAGGSGYRVAEKMWPGATYGEMVSTYREADWYVVKVFVGADTLAKTIVPVKRGHWYHGYVQG